MADEVKYLKQGYMSTQDLAAWFQESYSTFRKHSAKRYETLTQYCKYVKQHGGIDIEVVYSAIYIKDATQYLLIKGYTGKYWIPETFDTAVRVAHLIKKYCSDVTVTESTCADYVSQAKEELWPRPDKKRPGERGGSYREWVKAYRLQDDKSYVALTQEEKDIKAEIRKKYYPVLSDDEKDMLFSDYLEGRLGEQEYIKKINGGSISRDKFYSYLKEVAAALNCDYMTKATYVKDGVYFVTEIDAQGVPHRVEILVAQPKQGAF